MIVLHLIIQTIKDFSEKAFARPFLSLQFSALFIISIVVIGSIVATKTENVIIVCAYALISILAIIGVLIIITKIRKSKK